MLTLLFIFLTVFTSAQSCNTGCVICGTNNKCSVCDWGYYNQNGFCSKCLTGCSWCEAIFDCRACESQYYLDSKVCRACNACNTGSFYNSSLCTSTQSGCQRCGFGCANCTNSITCIDCYGGYYLNSSQECQVCPEGCTICSSATSCSACNRGYWLNGDRCEACEMRCERCTNATSCQLCKYGTTQVGSQCFGCPFPQGWCIAPTNDYNRIDCDGDSYEDHVCYDANWNKGTIRSTDNCWDTWPNGTVADCPVWLATVCPASCLTCNGWENCTTCKNGYFLNNGVCQACTRANCVDGQEYVQSLCLNRFSGCRACSTPNCKQCVNDTCTECSFGYTLGSDKTCQACGSNCDICSSSECLSCSENYYYNSQSCTACSCSDSTFECVDTRPTFICECKSGYFRDGNICRDFSQKGGSELVGWFTLANIPSLNTSLRYRLKQDLLASMRGRFQASDMDIAISGGATLLNVSITLKGNDPKEQNLVKWSAFLQGKLTIPTSGYFQYLSQPLTYEVTIVPHKEPEDIVGYYVLIIIAALLVILLLIEAGLKRRRPNKQLFTSFLCIIDFISDCRFAYSLNSPNADYYRYFYYSVLFIIIPLIINGFFLWLVISREKLKNPKFQQAFAASRGFIFLVFLGTFNSEHMLLLSSDIYGLQHFQNALSPGLESVFKAGGIIVTLLEDLPQMVIQTHLIISTNPIPTTAIVALPFSVVSLLFSLSQKLLWVCVAQQDNTKGGSNTNVGGSNTNVELNRME